MHPPTHKRMHTLAYIYIHVHTNTHTHLHTTQTHTYTHTHTQTHSPNNRHKYIHVLSYREANYITHLAVTTLAISFKLPFTLLVNTYWSDLAGASLPTGSQNPST